MAQGCPDGECEEGKTASGFPSLPPIYEPFWEPHESPFGKPADDLEQFKALSWPTDDGRPVVNGTNATDVEAEEDQCQGRGNPTPHYEAPSPAPHSQV